MKRSLFFLVSGFWILASDFSHAILDTNSNGLSDLWEREHNAGELFPANFDPQADSDSDGWTNDKEAAAGTSPFDPNPPDGLIRPTTGHIPAVWSVANGVPFVETPEAVTVTWPTLSGKQYTLFYSPDLTQGSWLSVDGSFIANGSEVTYNFPISQDDKCFWRVAVTDADTDGDGMTDHEENQSGSNPTTADSDDDGLSDKEEAELGTDPNAPDTDDDEAGDAEDAVPLDGEINWPKIPESKYVWIEQVMGGGAKAVSRHGHIMFPYSNYGNNGSNLQYVLWDSATSNYVTLTGASSWSGSGFLADTVPFDAEWDHIDDMNDEGVVVGRSKWIGLNPSGPPPVFAYAVMKWKMSGTATDQYAAPIYIVPGFEHTLPWGQLEEILADDSNNVPRIADDGTISALSWHEFYNPPDTYITNTHWVASDAQVANHSKEMALWADLGSDWYDHDTYIPNIYYRAGAVIGAGGGLLVEHRPNIPKTILYYRNGAAAESLEGLLPSTAYGITDTDIGRTPATSESSGGRIWFAVNHAGGDAAFLEKSAGGSGVSRWHNPPSMAEGAIRLNSQGLAITGGKPATQTAAAIPPKLWRNGKYTDLNDEKLTSKPSSVTITQAIDLASNGIILAQATENGVTKTGLLLPLDMTISHPEIDGNDSPEYVVNADIAETRITVGLSPAGDGSVIEWQIEQGNGTLSATESTTTDGFASTTLTTSINAGDTYKVKARIKKLVIVPADETSPATELDFSSSAYANLTGIEQTTDVITVIPGYAASITVQREPEEQGGSTTELPADGKSGVTFVATVKDQFGQPVAANTPVVWHLGGRGSIEPESPATDSSGIVRAKVLAGDASGQQTIRIEADGFEVNETLENTAVSGTLTAGAATLDIATGATTTLTASFPDVADGATIRWFASRGEILNAANIVEGGQATATLRAGGGRTGNAMVTASVGGTTHAMEIGFVSSSPISVKVEHPVIVGDETSNGSTNVPRVDGTQQSVVYQTSTPVTIKAPAYAGYTATVQFGTMASVTASRFHMDEIDGTVTPDAGAAHDATIQGATLDADHKHEGAASLYFNGETSSLVIADHADLRIQSGQTVSAWAHASAAAGTIISKPGEYRLFIDGQGRAVFAVTTTAGEQTVTGPVLPLHRWCRISASCEESGTITVRVDGVQAAEQIAGTLLPGTAAINIGEAFEGWLDLLEISSGKQFINGTGLDVSGLSGGQVVLDGNGEAVITLSSGTQSVVSAQNPVHGVAMRVSINPEVKLENVVVVVTKDAHAVIDAAMSDVSVTTSSQTSNLSGAIREDVVAGNLLEYARTGQRCSALPFVPAGNITDRLRYSHRAALWLGETVAAAQDIRDILENTHPLDLPSARKHHLADQLQGLLIESMHGGSDSGAGQYLEDAYGGLVGTLATASEQGNFKYLTGLVDGGAAFEDMALVHEMHGAGLIEDIADLAEHEAAEPTFCQRVLGIYRTVNDVANGQWQQTLFNNAEDFVRKYCQQGLDNGKLDASEAFDIGFGWGLAAEAQAMSQMTNQRAARRLSEQMAATVMLAIRGDENARKGLKEAIPFWGLKVMNDETNNLIEQEQYFDAGMKSAQVTVGIVNTAAAAGAVVGGMAKGAISLSRAAKNAAKPIKGGPPRLPASFGRAITQNYRKTFFDAKPNLQGKGYWVHHAVPQDAIKKGWITWQEGHSLPNLRGIPSEINVDVHLGEIAKAWNAFKKPYLKPGAQPPTKEALLKFATDMDDLHGMKFDPKTR